MSAAPAGRTPIQHRIRRAAPGDVIFRQEELGTEMYIIQRGAVEILLSGAGGDKRLALLEKGDFFGEMALLDNLPRSATARVVEDAELVEINGATFDQMLHDNPEIAVRIMRKLSRRVRDADRKLAAAAGAPTPEPAPAAAPEPASDRLVEPASGMELVLPRKDDISVGRRDPVTGIRPDIDLTHLDKQRSASRLHAKLQRRGGRLYVIEDLGTTNGTFVNGTRIERGAPAEVQSGDALRFGLVELEYSAG